MYSTTVLWPGFITIVSVAAAERPDSFCTWMRLTVAFSKGIQSTSRREWRLEKEQSHRSR